MRATHPLALLLIRESQWDFGWILKICPLTPTLLAELSGLENRHRLHSLGWH